MQAQSTHTDDSNPVIDLLAPDLITLIANPKNPVLSNEVVAKVGNVIGSSNLIWLGEHIACDIPLEGTSAYQPDELTNTINSNISTCYFRVCRKYK